MFKVNNQDTRTTLMACLYSSVSIVNSDQVNADWVSEIRVNVITRHDAIVLS